MIKAAKILMFAIFSLSLLQPVSAQDDKRGVRADSTVCSIEQGQSYGRARNSAGSGSRKRKGDVVVARALSGHVELQDAAIQAAYRWKFDVLMKEGKAARFVGTISFTFNP